MAFCCLNFPHTVTVQMRSDVVMVTCIYMDQMAGNSRFDVVDSIFLQCHTRIIRDCPYWTCDVCSRLRVLPNLSFRS